MAVVNNNVLARFQTISVKAQMPGNRDLQSGLFEMCKGLPCFLPVPVKTGSQYL